ncbi:MAG: 30S ribosomal protein S6 [Limnochordales bacterium]|nr:30S ribosomal protein S6 [Limnochordales bacterium]
MVIFDPSKVDGDEAVARMLDRIQGIVTGDGGKVTNIDRWGRRRLAYEIGGSTEGYYVVIQFEAEPKTAAELGRILRITDGVLRHMIVRPYPITRRARVAQAARRRNAEAAEAANQGAGQATPAAESGPEQAEADGKAGNDGNAEVGEVADTGQADADSAVDGAEAAQPVAGEVAERG